MVETLLNDTYTYVLVLVRFGGMIGFNPILARRGVPGRVRTGLMFLLTMLVAPGVRLSVDIATSLDLVGAIIRELMAGLILGFVFNIFYYMMFFTGDLMDTQFGLSMAKVFDPGTNIQLSVSSNVINLLFVLYIFATDSHLVMIHMFATSFNLVAAGAFHISDGVIRQMLELYIGVFSLALRLSFPFVAAEFALELSMGILMKLIPQIHVFVVNIQFKILFAIIMLLAFSSPIASFVDNYIGIMFEQARNVLIAMS